MKNKKVISRKGEIILLILHLDYPSALFTPTCLHVLRSTVPILQTGKDGTPGI